MDKIRVSCATIGSILIDEKYLLIQNKRAKSKGNIIYTPIGGAIEYFDGIRKYLEALEFEPERVTNDLRFHIPLNNLNKFKEWFYLRKQRDVSNFREAYEELVLEEKVLDNLSIKEFSESFIKCVEIEKSLPYFETDSYYMFEVMQMNFDQNLIDRLDFTDDKIKLFSKEEILTSSEVSEHSKYIITDGIGY